MSRYLAGWCSTGLASLPFKGCVAVRGIQNQVRSLSSSPTCISIFIVLLLSHRML
eukprot:gene10571-7341_t